MTYADFELLISKTGRVKLIDSIELLYSLYESYKKFDDIDSLYRVFDLVDHVVNSELIIGNCDDFHNISVLCAKHDDYDSACKLLDKGILLFPYNIDLIADYLQFGVKCGRRDKCSLLFQRINELKVNWNSRTYKYVILYLFDEKKNGTDISTSDIFDYISEFRDKYSSSEDAYLLEAEALSLFDDAKNYSIYDSNVEVLKYVTSDNSLVDKSPLCDLKLADAYLAQGSNIEDAIYLLGKCRRDSLEIQPSVNRGYLYLLSALCKMTYYYDNLDTLSEDTAKEIVEDVYKDYNISTLDNDNRIKECSKIIESFELETGISNRFNR